MAAFLRFRALEATNSILRQHRGSSHALVRPMWRVRWVVSVVALSCVMFGCSANKNRSGPVVEFTRVPRAGEGGPDRMEPIEGRVIRGLPGLRIVLFAHWGNWWVQPLADQPFTFIQPDSTWRNTTHYGTEYAALLVDSDYKPLARIDSLPSPGHSVVAVARVKGRPVFWQTWWFLLLATLASAGIVAAGFRYRMMRLAKEEQRFREAIETMPAIAFIAASDGRCTFVNRGWVEFTGLTLEQSAVSGWQSAVHPDDLSRLISRWRASLASGEALEHEIRIRRVADGAYRLFLIRAAPLKDKHGKILKWCGTATDIEDRQRAQQLQAILTHSNRVNSMGQLVASISHELLQPITASTIDAKTSLLWLQHDPPDLAKAREATERIIEAGLRSSGIIDHLRSLYKKAPPRRELVAMNEIVSEMAAMLRHEATRHGISIRTDLKDDLPMTVADRVQLQQVLMNLILNGIEAMSDTGGLLTVKSQLDADGNIQISVIDTGPGLPPCKADQLFEAFFTTKPQGSGMGLSISKSIVEAHGGRIWATVNGGCGATFHFALPPTDEKANRPTAVM